MESILCYLWKTKSSKTQETQTKSENITVEKQDKPTQTTVTKEELIQISKSQPSFNIQTEIAKAKI